MKNLSEERGEERGREGKQGKVGEASKSDAARLMVITPLPFGEGSGVRLLGVRLFLYPSCLKDFLFGIVDFLELAFGSPFDIVAKGGYTVGMMLESKLAVGSLDLLVSG